MSNNTRNDLKRKHCESSENTSTVRKFCSSPLRDFMNVHTKRFKICQEALRNMTDKCERLKILEINRNSTIAEQKRLLDEKTLQLDQLTANYEKLQTNHRILQDAALQQKSRFVDIEVTYDENVHKFEEVISQLQKVNELTSLRINAKEAECATYLKDMRNQLDNAESKYEAAKLEITSLQSHTQELETQLQKCQDDKAYLAKEIENIKENHKMELLKKHKKSTRKEHNIMLLKQQLDYIENEKKDLKKALSTESMKLRELQRVLNCPYSRISPTRDQSATAIQPIVPITPLNAENDTNTSTVNSLSSEPINGTQINTNEICPVQNIVTNTPTQQPQAFQDVNSTCTTNISKQQPQAFQDVNSTCTTNISIQQPTYSQDIRSEVMRNMERQYSDWDSQSISSQPPLKESSALNNDFESVGKSPYPTYMIGTVNDPKISKRMENKKHAPKHTRK